jgi:hypothetical protein
MAHTSTTCAAIGGKFRLAGRVAGIDACQLISDCDKVIVGSSVNCDLVVTDPLVPAKAFRLTRQRDHSDSEQDCRTYWLLETYPGARVYVNNDLLRRGHVTLGDTIALGCHQFQFSVADPVGRNCESNTEIDDLCDQLIQPRALPPGYLEGCPSWANRRRTRIASAWTIVLAVIVLTVGLLTPREEKYIQMQPPMEVINISEDLPEATASDTPAAIQRQTSPHQHEVRSLATVQRKTIADASETTPSSDILPNQADTVKTLETAPLDTASAGEPAKPAAPQLDPVDVSANAALPSLQVSRSDEQPAATITRTVAQLDPSSQGVLRRQSVAEGNDPSRQTELSDVGTQINSNSFSSATDGAVAAPIDQATGPITRSVAKPSAPQLDKVDVSATPGLASIQVAHGSQPAATVTHTVAKLEGGSQGPGRRLSVQEANDPIMQKELGGAGIKISSNTFTTGTGGGGTATAINQWSGPVTHSVAKPSQVKLEGNRDGEIASMSSYAATPLGHENYQGIQIPVARLPGDLHMEGVDDERAALHGKPNGAIVIDGSASDENLAMTWKSEKFHIHAAGTPVEANPNTQCFVGKKEKNGKQYLYIAFHCKDPNLDQLVLHESNGSVYLTRDDSIEIFLDTNRSRSHYYQMIVNARGNSWTGSVDNFGGGKYTIRPEGWDAQAEVKTTINKEAGRWSCEILIPFDRLGGVPAKGTSWGVNFCRNFRGQGEDDSHLQTWFSVYEGKRNFHNPALFGAFDW